MLKAGDTPPFDVHAHTGADIDGTTRSSEEHLRDLEAVGGRSVIFPLCVTTGYERWRWRSRFSLLQAAGFEPGDVRVGEHEFELHP